MPVALPNVYCTPQDIYELVGVDAAQLAPLLQTLDPRTTLFVVVSKTLSTQETAVNAKTARDWLLAKIR